jgi:capsular polysaccharide biosynthesis protein
MLQLQIKIMANTKEKIMNTQQNNLQNQNEIDLRELVMSLWEQKILIISITFIAAIITGIYSMFVISPVYHAKLNIVINMPETYKTKYGDYILPITTNQQYINLITSNNILESTIHDMGYDTDKMTIDDLKEKIVVDSIISTIGVEQNSFKVTIAADDPVEAQQLSKVLFDNYLKFLDVLTAEGAINFYINNYTIELKSLKVYLETARNILGKNEELLADTAQTINQKEAMQEIQDQINTSEYVVLEDIINPNYTAIENNIIENKQSINNFENSIRVYNEYLKELDIVKNDIKAYNETGQFEELGTKIVSVSKTNVYLPSDPIVPSQKISPSNTKNVFIGTLLGGMISIIIVLIRVYWLKKA